jgi:hypothetical protein
MYSVEQKDDLKTIHSEKMATPDLEEVSPAADYSGDQPKLTLPRLP